MCCCKSEDNFLFFGSPYCHGTGWTPILGQKTCHIKPILIQIINLNQFIPIIYRYYLQYRLISLIYGDEYGPMGEEIWRGPLRRETTWEVNSLK